MRVPLLTLGLVILPFALRAAEPDAWVEPARLLQASTVTVRVTNEAADNREASAAEQPDADSPTPSITICTGICVGNGQIITSVVASSDSKIRLTLPGGVQADAKLRAIDEYSGLTLLETEKKLLPALELAKDKPAIGSGVMIASAWGAEQPLVAVGVVAANDRLLRGATYPPLIQCDIRVAETSAGAGVVNSQGKLIGILVATDSEQSRRDGGYATSVSHLERLLRMAERTEAQDDKGVIILKRQRPIVGMRLEGDENAVFVRHLSKGGPAEKAGLQVGDQIVATDGVAIRSVYQAVLPSLHKQPGDTMRFRVQREGTFHTYEVVLGGGVELSTAPRALLSELIQPQLQVGRDASGAYVARSRPGHLVEVFAPAEPEQASDPQSATPAQKLAILEKALDRYRKVIELQQQQIESLRGELKAKAAPPADQHPR
jgi:S1-C subfamily serine protease